MKQHPAYKSAFETWKKSAGRSTAYLSCADTAKLIRTKLKAAFPGVKFSVRSNVYSGGASIDVSWTDGPTHDMVNPVCQTFAGSGFDGMTDYKYSVGAWLLPNGDAAVRSVEAHFGHEGEVIEAQADGAIPVSFGADFVFCRREISEEAMKRALRSYAHRYPGDELAEAIKAGLVGTEPSRWGGYQLTGNPSQYRGVGDGSQYGGDIVLKTYAGRRMVAA